MDFNVEADGVSCIFDKFSFELTICNVSSQMMSVWSSSYETEEAESCPLLRFSSKRTTHKLDLCKNSNL